VLRSDERESCASARPVSGMKKGAASVRLVSVAVAVVMLVSVAVAVGVVVVPAVR